VDHQDANWNRSSIKWKLQGHQIYSQVKCWIRGTSGSAGSSEFTGSVEVQVKQRCRS
jgi:hypothetical protein